MPRFKQKLEHGRPRKDLAANQREMREFAEQVQPGFTEQQP
jgi:hypothetical protein